MSKLPECIGGDWNEVAGGFCREALMDEVKPAAERLLEAGARFVTLVGRATEDGKLALCWYFDINGTLLWVGTTVAESESAPSIVDIYPGADWAEREARDYFAITFSGRDDAEPLMLRPEDSRGVLLPKRKA